jgi:hypothetical protein
MRMQGVSRGYPSSNLGITQRRADQMVVVRKIEGQRPKFPPVIGLDDGFDLFSQLPSRCLLEKPPC